MVRIKKDRCKGCKLCIFYCPTKHLKLSSDLNKKGLRYVEINKAYPCTSCGFCFIVCPDNCLEVE